ncbi:MAG: PQQ-dependent sugar dehydrogenase [Ardenticatenaceae bacterium]|nr:PQQ-dependent sugar dehydrogenase [Ardenticatenaceae bacterium]
MTTSKSINLLLMITLPIGLLIFLMSAVAGAAPAADPPALSLKPIANGFANPLAVVASPLENDGRLFVLQKEGGIRVIDKNGQVLPDLFLDVGSLIGTAGERGLLGMAFDPNFSENGHFYLNYTRKSDGATMVSRFTLDSPLANQGNIATEKPIIRIPQDFENHNGGDIHFGPDGYLYIALGDGGSGDDPNNRAQTLSNLLGSILRIDIDETAGLPADCGQIGSYSVPADNPFVNEAGACNEIWAYGIRNAWRMSFDRLTGDMYFGDVGQNSREEVNFQPASSSGGENYGWRCLEGNIPTPGVPACTPGGNYVPPIYDYPRTLGNSVTGGYVYRGESFPRMKGIYIFGDFGSGQLFRSVNDGGWSTTVAEDLSISIVSFDETNEGELLVVDYSGGAVYQIIDELGLNVAQDGPTVVQNGQQTELSFTVTNVGSAIAPAVVLTNTLPAGVSYVSGGSWDGSTVTWNLGDLSVGGDTTVSLTVTSTQTYTNSQVFATATGIDAVQGEAVRVFSFDQIYNLFLPVAVRE